MDLFEVMMKRRSVRNFEDRPIQADLLDELLEAANNAPSGGNIQPMSIVVVESEEGRGELAKMVGEQPWVRNAPVSLVFCLDFHRTKRWAEMFGVEFRAEQALGSFLIAYADIMCAAQNVVILAEARGLGSVYVGTIQGSTDEARKYFDMPDHVLPMMVLSLGYPKSVPRTIPKLPVDVVVHRERYRTASDDEIRDAMEAKYGEIDADIERYFERAYVEVVEADKQQDESWIEEAKARMERLNIKSNAEFLFKLRYPTPVMARMSARLAKALSSAGFDFAGLRFEEDEPAES